METKDKNKTSNASSTDKSKDTTTKATNAGLTQDQDASTQSTSIKAKNTSEIEKEGPLYKFFTDMLKDMYYAEKKILETLPKMQKAATTDELQEAFEDHHLQTQKQISRLERVFKSLGEKAEGKKCDAIDGIVKEGEKCIEDTEDGSMTRDAALIIAAQKVEHYEIASYGGLCALAETMELYDVSELLHVTLEEECKTDGDLTYIAESFINFRATEDEDEVEYEDEYEYDEEKDYNESYNNY